MSQSKGNLLYNVENTDFQDEKLLEETKTNLTKCFDRLDWIDYAVELKKNGLGNSAVVDKIPYTESWIKKYVNPILARDTIKETITIDTSDRVTPELMKVIELNVSNIVPDLEKGRRIFDCLGSVEILDSHGDMVGISGIENSMPTYMLRGAPLIYGHSNRVVGRLLKWKTVDVNINGTIKPGIWLQAEVFKNYRIDDIAWEAIQIAKRNNVPVLSLGATPIGSPVKECDDNRCYPRYNNIELYEWTITAIQRGSKAANPGAKILATKEKSELLKAATIITNDLNQVDEEEEFVNLMLGKCSECQEEFARLIKAGYSEKEAKSRLLDELIKTMSEEKTTTDAQPELTKEAAVAEPVIDNNEELYALLKASLAQNAEYQKQNAELIALLKKDKEEESKQQEGPETPRPAPTEEETKEGVKTKKKETVEIKLSANPKLEELLAKAGYQKIASTPAPTLSKNNDIAKNVPEKPKFPTSEELVDAMNNPPGFNSLNNLAEKYGYKE